MIKNMKQKELHQLEQAFKALDKSDTGYISLVELKEAFQKMDIPCAEVDFDEDKLNLKHPGMLSYSEFLEASINKERSVSKRELSYAFSYFDADKSGFIT